MSIAVAAEPEVRFRPHPGQRPVWLSNARYLALIAGSGGGKTYFAPRWLLREFLEIGDGARAMTVAPNYTMLAVAERDLLEFFDRDMGILTDYHQTRRVMTLKNGRDTYTIQLASADHPHTMEGQHVHRIWLDEAGLMARLAFEVAQRRVGYLEGRLLITTTPYSINWLKTDVLDRYLAGDPDYFVSQFASTVNPKYSETEFERARRRMSPARFAMMMEGRFEKPAGLIYPDFTESDHTVEPFDIPQDWSRHAALDLGWNNPTAGLMAALDGDDVLWVTAEYYQPERTVSQHVEAIHSLEERHGEHEWSFDPAGKALAEEYKAQGLYMQPADNDVLAGIAEVTARLRTGRLKFFRGLANTFDEISAYRWAMKPGTEEPIDKPVKERDHLMDALRYLCMAVRGGSGEEPTWL